MLKRLAVLTAILTLGALPALAESPCNSGNGNAGGNLTQFIESLKVPAATTASVPTVATAKPAAPAVAHRATEGVIMLASKPGKPGSLEKSCTATEDCDGLPDISCGGTVCNAVSRDCTSGGCERGSVTCNGVTTYCSQVCPPNCTNFQCKQACHQPGCFSYCIDTCTCECDVICN